MSSQHPPATAAEAISGRSSRQRNACGSNGCWRIPAEILFRLRLIGEVFANALLRRRAEESLRAALDENQKLRQRTCIFASKSF